MLTIVFMRHAQANDWAETDFERTLTNRGRMQAVESAHYLASFAIRPDVVLCSSAVRARQTAEIVCRELSVTVCSPSCSTSSDASDSGSDSAQISLSPNPALYESYTTQDLIDMITAAARQKPGAKTILVVGHNPDISYRSSNLSPDRRYVNFPTAGVWAVVFNVNDWESIEAMGGRTLCSNFL